MLDVIFMGTPDFAVPSLEILHKHHNVLAVVTAPDKPAGRGRKLKASPVKNTAQSLDIPVYQPEKLKEADFVNAMQALNPDLMVVVAFRMLPEIIWKIPKIGTFNLHASLLPQYRGAAPINHAIINGEKLSGNTTFFIDDKIDTGNILLQDEIEISDSDTAGSLHDKLMLRGADLILETVNKLEPNSIKAKPQNTAQKINYAPKIFKADCEIDWSQDGKIIYNKIRGLSPYPGAWTNIRFRDEESSMKILNAKFIQQKHNDEIGQIIQTEKDKILVAVENGLIQITELQIQSKKRLADTQFLNGYKLEDLKIA
ncbi:MAG: methionyl-tRNA formyltransferase [Bacteroidales bacterium]|jgi:methionyl-tRNA formyltransferase|nr:methionyl-tRNA formyltransferase [Bacteroidales bacterium]